VECKDVMAQLSDYLDPESAKELCEEFDTHFKTCTNCRVNIDTVKKTITLYRSETPRDCPEPVREKLHAVLSYEYARHK
jgi:predicted anti-sigma-YlaC factor YlaD